MKKKAKIFFSFLILLIFSAGIGLGLTWQAKKNIIAPKAESYSDPYLAFLNEVYETISQNYWEKTDEEQLINLFVLASEKATGEPLIVNNPKKDEFFNEIASLLKNKKTDEEKKELAAQIADVTLANLKPFGRSRLYTQKEETALSKNVNNVTETDFYEILGVSKEAKEEEISRAYEGQKQELEKSQIPGDQEKLAQIEKAYGVLEDTESKQLYDQAKIEPTMTTKLLTPEILYLKISKFSPTTVEELQRVTQKFDQGETLDTLIIDLRDNIGGAIDGLPYFLGPFIGNNQYAYQFFHQGETTDYKTKTGWLGSLLRYKKVVVLINSNSQSSAEVMASVIKKYNVGILIGSPTKGWGTVEKIFPLKNQPSQKEKFSIFLVHSLTLREDGEPIEGHGVEPIINLSDPDWDKQLLDYFNYPQLISNLREII
ncbi:MAG: S41 family peptidase [Candidatus Shapirobacteria bacterium]